jgi:hypothetical protein
MSAVCGSQIDRDAGIGTKIQIVTKTALRRAWSGWYAPAAIISGIPGSAAANARRGAFTAVDAAVRWTVGSASAVARIPIVAGSAAAHPGEDAIATVAAILAMGHASLAVAGWIDVPVTELCYRLFYLLYYFIFMTITRRHCNCLRVTRTYFYDLLMNCHIYDKSV